MKLNLFSTYDSKAKAWTLPFFLPENDSIHRAWTEVVNDPQTRFGQYPEDYTMFQIGHWDVVKGELHLLDAKESIGVGSQFLKPKTDISSLISNPVLSSPEFKSKLRKSSAKKAKK